MKLNILGIVGVQMAFASCLFAQDINLDQIRRDFNKGHKDENLCASHLKALEEQANTPVERGYEAAYHMFMAKHAGNPFKKMSYFKAGKAMLEKEITSNPQNVELRFIRLCIQFYVPKYLSYSDNIEADKKYLMNNLYKISDKEVKDLIFQYLKGAKMYTENELALLGR